MTEEKRLACPLSFANHKFTEYYCLEERCAWWESYEEACSLLVFAKLAVSRAIDMEAGV